MDILTIINFQKQLLDFINSKQNIMLEMKYLVLQNLTDNVKNTLIKNQHQLMIKGLQEVKYKLEHPEENIKIEKKHSQNNTLSKD